MEKKQGTKTHFEFHHGVFLSDFCECFLNLLSKVGQPKPVDETSEKGLRVVVEAET